MVICLEKNSVKKYFNSNASGYDRKKTSGLTGFLVEKERGMIFEFLDVHPGERVLDAGCGTGFYSKLIQDLGAYPYGVDISEEMIDRLQAKCIDGEVGDVASISLNRKFDKILSAGSIEFTGDSIKFLMNLRRHLKDGGFLVMLYPHRSIIGFLYLLFHRTHGIRVKLYSLREITRLLEDSGFELLDLKKCNPIASVLKAQTI